MIILLTLVGIMNIHCLGIHYSFPSYAPQCQISSNSLDESSSSHEKMSRIEDMFQRYIDNENDYRARDDEKLSEQTLALDNLAIKVGELTSQLESLMQKGWSIDMLNDSCEENMVSNGELVMRSDDVLSRVSENFEGDSELKIEEGENNIECAIEVQVWSLILIVVSK